MKQLRLPIFNSKIKIYNLRIIPEDHIFSQILELKKHFEYLFGKHPLSGSKPHITIASFRMNSKHQDLLIEVLDQLSQIHGFTLKIDGFDVFEPSRTLCLNIGQNDSLAAIYNNVRSLQKEQFKKKLRSFEISEPPYMTISRTTNKNMLYESLQHFQKNNYSGKTEVGHLTLVSRSKYKPWDWEHHIKLATVEV